MKKTVRIKRGVDNDQSSWGSDAYTRRNSSGGDESFLCTQFVKRLLKGRTPKLAWFEISESKFDGAVPICIIRDGDRVNWFNQFTGEISDEMFEGMEDLVRTYLDDWTNSTVIWVKLSDRYSWQH